MEQPTQLQISGYRADDVANTFFPRAPDTDELGIVLPGWGYSCRMPVLYYATLALRERGAGVLWVEYDYSNRADFRNADDGERERWIRADVTAAYQAAQAQSSSARLTITGKSLGTLATAALLSAVQIPAATQIIWLTPLLTNPRLRQQIIACGCRSLIVIGSEDPYYRSAHLDEVAAGGAETLLIERAGHDLEVGGDIEASLAALRTVTLRIGDFLAGAAPA